MNDINALYKLWLENTNGNKEIYDELKSIEGKDDEILDRFYRSLEFGTAGLRGILGAGTNRMNVYTVNQATQGLADYLNSDFDSPRVAIAYDSRINSELFAKSAAGVLAANGIEVYIYDRLVPTPMLSFAVRELKCSSGIVITASHNPSKYNGYKCYDPNGYQMTDEAAAKTYDFIGRVDMFSGVKTVDFEKALGDGMIRYIPESVFESFYSRVLSCQINPGIAKDSGLKLIYTPLNGTGREPVTEILSRIGLNDVRIVPEQEMPDGNFPTCPYPNPEIRQAFERALDMAKGGGADLLLATDPDCDRVGIAVNDNGEYRLLSGNEVGVLLTEYILSCRQKAGTLPKDPLIIKSFVTTDLVSVIADEYSAGTVDLLTGFKYIGELITKLEAKGEADRFIVGMEESYGYLSGTHARDKDAVVGSMLIAEMAAYYKSLGKSLYDVINDIYAKYGRYLNTVISLSFEGASGMEKMKNIMDTLRREPPAEIAGMEVLAVSDYIAKTTTDTKTGEKTPIDLPCSNVLAYSLPEKCKVIVRPSGTEPKIKIYITSVASDLDKAQSLADKLADFMKNMVNA